MQPQELFNIYDPAIYDLWTGGSCVGKVGGPKPEMKYEEIRILPKVNDPDINIRPWNYIQDSIDLGKKFTVNIDQFISPTVHWLPGEVDYKKFVDF